VRQKFALVDESHIHNDFICILKDLICATSHPQMLILLCYNTSTTLQGSSHAWLESHWEAYLCMLTVISFALTPEWPNIY